MCRRIASFRPSLEQLEDRLAPANAVLNGDNLTITFIEDDEEVIVSNDGTNITLAGDVSGTTSFNTASVNRITITASGSSMNQSITFASGSHFTLSGGITSTGVEWVTLEGSLDTLGSILDVADGILRLLGGTLRNTTAATATNAEFRMHDGTLDGVTIAAGSIASTMTNASVTVVNGLTVDGTLTLSGGHSPSHGLLFSGTQQLGGTGLIVFSTAAQRLGLNQDDMTLTIGPELTIESIAETGIVGMGFSNGSVVNYGTLRALGGFRIGSASEDSNTFGTFTNASSGRIEVLDGTFTINSINWINHGTVLVQEDELNVLSTWTNDGLIEQIGGSTYLWGLGINQGAIQVAGGLLSVADTWINQGDIVQSDGEIQLAGLGSNLGTIEVAGGTLTATGAWENAGSITQSAGILGLYGTWTNTSDGTIRVSGGILDIGGEGNNLGTIEQSEGVVSIFALGTNLATIRISGGELSIGSYNWTNVGTIDQTGGTVVFNFGGSFTLGDLGNYVRLNGTAGTLKVIGDLENANTTLVLDTAENGIGTVIFAGWTLRGGTVETRNGAELRLEGYVTLDDVTIAGGSVVATNPWASVTITNDLTVHGTFILDSSWMYFQGTQILSGDGGQLVFASDASIILAQPGTTLTIEEGITVSGPGTSAGSLLRLIGSNGFQALLNKGTFRLAEAETISFEGQIEQYINAVEGQIIVEGHSSYFILASLSEMWTNQGSIQVHAGTFVAEGLGSNHGVITIDGGVCGLGGLNSVWLNHGVIEIKGGELNARGIWSSSGIIDQQAGTITLDGSWTNQGTIHVGGGSLTTSGSWGNLGSINQIDGTVTLDGIWSNHETIEVRGGTLTASGRWNNEGIIHQIGGAVSLEGEWNNRSSIVVGGGTLSARGTWSNEGIVDQGDGAVNLDGEWTNRNTIVVSAGSLFAQGNWSNLGAFIVKDSGVIDATVAPTNFVGGTLAGGRWEVQANGTLRLSGGITTNAADLVLDGANSNIYVGASGTTDALAGFLTNLGGGRFTVRNGRSFVPSSTFTNAGQLFVGTGSTFGSPSHSVVQTSGGITLLGGTLTAGQINVQGGTLGGTGTINGDVFNAGGVLAPGTSAGSLTIDGDYVQGPSGTFLVELGGRVSGTEFDRVLVTGTASLAGRIEARQINGFVAAPGDTFRVLTANSVTGTFSVEALESPGQGRRFNTLFYPTHVTLEVQAAPPLSLRYAFGLGGVGLDAARDVVTDTAGNTCVAGNFSGTATIGGSTVTAMADQAAFIAKYAADGSLLWLRVLDAAAGDSVTASAIALDPTTGQVAVTGSFTGTAALQGSGLSVTSLGGRDVFVLNLDASGALLNLVSVGGSGDDEGQDVAVNASGHRYLTGYYSGTADFDPSSGTFALISAGSADAFILELTSSGGFVRASRLGGTGVDVGEAIAVTAGGTVAATGRFQSATTGLASLTPNPMGAGEADVFVVIAFPSGSSFTTSGGWAQSYGSAEADAGQAIAFDTSGNVLVGGFFGGSVDFDANPTGAFTLTSSGLSDGFVLKLTGTGVILWARPVGGYLADRIHDVQSDALGNVYYVGSFSDIVDFDPLDGIYKLGSAGGTDAFVAKLDSAGRFQWAVTAGGVSDDSAEAVALDAARNVFVAGYFTGADIDFDPQDAHFLLSSSSGSADGFIWALRQKLPPMASIAGVPVGAVSEGSTVILTAVGADTDTSEPVNFSWEVTRDGEAFETATGGFFALHIRDDGRYEITLTATDGDGLTTTATTLIGASNAAPALVPTEFSSPTTSANPTPASGDDFGRAIAVGSGFYLVGAPRDDTVANDAGAAYLYNSAGNLVRTFLNPAAAATAAGDLFGWAVAIFGDYIAIGAPWADANGGNGAVFVYDLSTGSLRATLTGPTGGSGDEFGRTLVALGNALVIGAPGRDTAVGDSVGEVYLFGLDGTTASLLRTISNPTPEVGDRFGDSLAAEGARILIGAPFDDRGGLDAGAAYLFEINTGTLLCEYLNPYPAGTGGPDLFGFSVAFVQGNVAIGAPLEDHAGSEAGAVYLFSGSSNGSLLTILSKPAADAGTRFGSALTSIGPTLLVGADGMTTAGVSDAGAAYQYDAYPLSPSFGNLLTSLRKTSPTAGDRLGASVAVLGRNVLLGAPGTASLPGEVQRFAGSSFVTRSVATVNEGSTLRLTGWFTDPGMSDGHAVLVDWKDGTRSYVLLPAGTLTFAVEHVYLDDEPPGTASDQKQLAITLLDADEDLLASSSGSHEVYRYDLGGIVNLGPGIAASSGSLNNPQGIAIGPDGHLYVASAGSNSILRYDVQNGAFLSVFVSSGSGGLSNPTGITFGPDGHLYVSSFASDAVLRYHGTTGAFLGTFVAAGSGGLDGPEGLVFGPDGHLYVSSSHSDAILRYSGTTGAFLGQFNTGDSNPPLDAPSQLAFGSDSSLYVVSSTTGHVYRYDGTTGQFLSSFPVDGSDLPEVPDDVLRGLVVGADGALYVSSSNNLILRYDGPSGVLLGVVADGDGLNLPGYLALRTLRDTTTTTITVTNVAPVVTVRSAPASTQALIRLTSSVSDVGVNDTFNYAWSVTNGTAVGSTTGPDFSFVPGSGTIVVTLTVTDDDTGVTTTRTQFFLGTDESDFIYISNGDLTSGTNRVIVLAFDGNDYVDASGITTVPVELVGGAGNDVLIGGGQDDVLIGNSPGDYDLADGGDHSSDILIGGYGNDYLDGGLGDDSMVGGGGDDTYVVVPGSIDLLDEVDGGSGKDTVTFHLAYRAVTVDLSLDAGQPQTVDAAGNQVILLGAFENLTGSRFNDHLTGNRLDNVIFGGAGNDTIYAGVGNDIIFGGEGSSTIATGVDDDIIFGGAGNDTIVGGLGNDIIFGGEGSSTLTTGLDNDIIFGGAGNDTILAGTGNDIIFGGDSSDTIAVGLGNDIIFGGEGNSTLTTGLDHDIIFGGAGNDTIVGGLGNDIIFGGDGVTTITAGVGSDIIFGGEGSTTIATGVDDDIIFGGAGNDTIYAGVGNDIIFGGEPLEVSRIGPGGVIRIGGQIDETLGGGSGDDFLVGGPGNDTLSGGQGRDVFEGQLGFDTIYESRDAHFVITPTQLTVGTDPSEVFFDIEAVFLSGGPGNNLLDASTFPGPVILSGGAGNDTLLGGRFGDLLLGGAGNDSILGGSGDDTLDGGAGNDTLDGGLDNDFYILKPNSHDRLIDAKGIDFLDFSAATYGISLNLAEIGTDQAIDVAGNGVTLLGIFENVLGTGFADLIVGNELRNVIAGAGGQDRLEGGPGDDVLQGGVTQVVYLDFDSATGKGEHVYTVAERNAIQARLEKVFAPFSVVFSQTAPATGAYATLLINGSDSEALIGGIAEELDWRNTSRGATASVNVNGYLGRFNRPPATSENFVALTATVAAHELGHLLGLRHADAYGPLGINPATGLPYGIYQGLVDKGRVQNEVVTNNGAPGSTGQVTLTYQLRHAPIVLSTEPITGRIYDGSILVGTFTVDTSAQVQVATVAVPEPSVLSGTLDVETGRLQLVWSGNPGFNQIVISYRYDPYRPGYRGPTDAFETPRHIMASPASLNTSLADALGATFFGERELIKLAFAEVGVAIPEQSAPHDSIDTAQMIVLQPLAVPNTLPAGTVNHGKNLVVSALGIVGSIELRDGRSESDFYAFSGQAGDLINLEIYSRALAGRFSDTIDSILRVYDSTGNLVPYFSTVAFNDDSFESQDATIFDLILPNDGLYFIEVDTFAFDFDSDTDVGGYELFIYRFAVEGNVTAGGDLIIGGPGFDVFIGSVGNDLFIGSPDEDLFIGLAAGDVWRTTLGSRPIPTADVYELLEDDILDVPLSAGLLANDSSENGGNLYAVLVTGPEHGSLELRSDGTFRYTPQADFHGTDSFTYRAINDEGQSEPVTVTLIIASVNDAPMAANGAFTVAEDGTLTGSVTATDVDGDTLSYTLISGPSHGTLELNADGTFTYRPSAHYFGPDSFTFGVSDGQGGTATGVAFLTVDPINDTPALGIINLVVSVSEGSTAINTGQWFDFDPDDVVTLSASIGTVTRHANGSWSWSLSTSDSDQSGTVQITATDSAGASTTVEFELRVANVAPSIVSLSSNAGPDGCAGLGIPVTISGSWSDPGTTDVHRVVIHWGDGSETTLNETHPCIDQSARIFEASHQYSTGGIFTIVVTVLDDDGGSTAQTLIAYVRGVGVVDGQLQIIGTGQRDRVVVRQAGGTIKVATQFGLGGSEGDCPDGRDDEMEQDCNPDEGRSGWCRVQFASTTVSSLFIDVRGGDDRVWIGSLNARPVTIHGGPGNDRLRGSPGADLIVDLSGHNVIWSRGGNDTIHAGDGNDWIWADGGDDLIHTGNGSNCVHASTGDDTIFGGDGRDILDAGHGDDYVQAGAGNDMVQGGSGEDILVGADGDDLLVGGQGRDLLIGGRGKDRLVGNADDDILVAGRTAYDSNLAALSAIMAEWASTRSYAARVANIMGDTSSSHYASRANGNFFLYAEGTTATVLDDGEEDLLTGSAGQDWFLFNRDGDGGVRDRVTDLHASEFQTDIDFINGNW
ncbi:MAG: tandem-95 repeat protein [Gemmatales bacterium]|nr:tandem-95 repeat protein [Gemmatales bacterium]MDW8388302.1 tandem-95 repeat protein [Gemmatales bacterium]